MCHLALVFPVIALPVFWLLPPGIAVSIYSVVLLVTGIVYFKLAESLRFPVVTGREALLRMTGEVEQTQGSKVLVRINSERWSAVGENLEVGDLVKITAIDGLVLKVRKFTAESGLSKSVSADTHACH